MRPTPSKDKMPQLENVLHATNQGLVFWTLKTNLIATKCPHSAGKVESMTVLLRQVNLGCQIYFVTCTFVSTDQAVGDLLILPISVLDPVRCPSSCDLVLPITWYCFRDSINTTGYDWIIP